MKKFLKILLIVVVSFAAILYGSVFLGHRVLFPVPTLDAPTIEAVTDGTLTLGVQAHTHPTTMEEYINLLAGQIRRYNEIVPVLWPGDALTNQSAIVEDIDSNNFWLIEPDGTVTPLSKDEALEFGFNRIPRFGGFEFFDRGVYLAVFENDLTNYHLFQRYLHLGTYDAFITFAHELFHVVEQANWPQADNLLNRERNEFLENIPARAKRDLLQRQILRAVSQPGNTQLVLEALSTYRAYKSQFPDDYQNSKLTDRLEGTAFYFELITSLYSAYPDQIRNEEDLEHALALLATREDVYVVHGLVIEGYNLGGFTSVLLSRYVDDWKTRLINDPMMTPIEMLYQHFNAETLPEPIQLTQMEIDAVGTAIQTMSDGSGLSLFFRFLYEILF